MKALLVTTSLVATLVGCGDSDSKLKDLTVGSSCTDTYTFTSNDPNPAFRLDAIPSDLTAADGVTKDGGVISWRKAGTFGLGHRSKPYYIAPKSGYLIRSQNLPIGAGGTVQAEVEFDAFESYVTWDINSAAGQTYVEKVRYEADAPIAGVWRSKPVDVGNGQPNLEVRAFVEDIKAYGSAASVWEQIQWVPAVNIKSVKVIHMNPKYRVDAGDESCAR
jgi:hypothetical protein